MWIDVDDHDNGGILSCIQCRSLKESDWKLPLTGKGQISLCFSVFLSFVLRMITHQMPSSAVSFCLSLSNCFFNQRIGPKSVSNIMTGPIAMEITSVCQRHGLFWRTPRTKQSQYILVCQSQCSLPSVICQNSSTSYLITQVESANTQSNALARRHTGNHVHTCAYIWSVKKIHSYTHAT